MGQITALAAQVVVSQHAVLYAKLASATASCLQRCVAVGTVLVLGWLLHVGSDAVRGGDSARAPQVLLLVVAAFVVLVAVLGVFYQ